MNSTELEAAVKGDSVIQLQNWSSLWLDLLHVDMVLHSRESMPVDASNLFARRALWEAAVVAYGRTAMSGTRQLQVRELIDALGPGAEQCHEDVMAWRNEHVAHRVDQAREKAVARAIIDPEHRRLIAVRVRVTPALGPEEEDDDLVARFQRHVKALRDYTWEQRIRPLETQVMEERANDVDTLLAIAVPAATPDGKGFSIDINPSGAAS